MKALKVEFLENEKAVVCTHSLLNSILLEWQDRVKQQGVATEIFVEAGFDIDFMRGIDILAIFGNLLDNAGEVACQCEDGKVEVQLFMQNSGAFLVIYVKNNYSGRLCLENGELLTTKEGEDGHGIGLKNIKETVENYRGYIQNQYSEHIYETTITIPCVTERKQSVN